MGCRGRHLFALLFLLPSLAFASNISECFSSAPLEKFWEHPGYFDYSPHVSNLGIFKIFSYEFDNSTQSLGLHNLSIISSQELSSAINPKFKNEFSPILKEIEDAQAHLAAAKTAQSQSHELSLAAQRFASQILDQNTFYLLAIPQTSTAATILIFLKTQDASRYVSLYPASLVETYSQSAKAYDSVQRAAHLASILVDEKMHQLSFAGANSAKYSGKAKSTYYNYQTLLSSRVFCNRSKAEQIRKYFSSKPQMPNFSSTGFADHILQTAGEGNSSSLFILAKAYSELSAAYDSMEQEYAQARLLASDSSRKLASQISQLEAEKLELIDSLPNTKKEASVSAGAGFSGLSSGLKIAKERLVSSQLLLSSSQEIAKSKSYPNYLSDAIEMASRSHQDSQTALTSLSRIRENAAEATELKRQEAQEAIARAEELLFEQVGTELPQDSQLRAQAFVVLGEAKKKFAQASQAESIGQKFQLYSQSKELAYEALSVFQSKNTLSAKEAASKVLQSLSDLISRASKDGIDTQYENEKLSNYRQLLKSLASAEAIFAIQQAADADAESILLRLSEKYHKLPFAFSEIEKQVLELRSTDSTFLPEFESIAKYFSTGSIDLQQAVGKLSIIESKLEEFSIKVREKAPSHLSAVLSRNAEAFELREPFIIGQPTKYHARISTKNTGSISYNGTISFLVSTSSQLFLQDFKEGDPIKDAYPKGGKTQIEIQSTLPQQSLSFVFEKNEQPVQLLSLSTHCQEAFQEEAFVEHQLKFFAHQPVDSALFKIPLVGNAASAKASYNGRQADYILLGGREIEGKISYISKGEGQISILHTVPMPFVAEIKKEDMQNLGRGRQAVSMLLQMSEIQLDCDKGIVLLHLPYKKIENLYVEGLDGNKAKVEQLQSAAGTTVKISFFPLARDSKPSFAVSFELQDKKEELEYALQVAELSAQYSNSTRHKAAIEQAKRLAEMNLTDEALVAVQSAYLLMHQANRLELISYQEAQDYANKLFSSAISAQNSLIGLDSSLHAELSKSIADLQNSISASSYLAEEGNYAKATQELRKASENFKSQLASLAFKASKEASQDYAKAKERNLDSELLFSCTQAISSANSLLAQGEALQALSFLAKAQNSLSKILELEAKNNGQQLAESERIAEQFAILRQDFEEKLSFYSTQYASLSSQSKKKLPLSPSIAQSRLSEAQKKLSLASKTKEPKQKMEQINESYTMLLSAHRSLSDTIENLRSSAESSLRVAKIALAEVQEKAPQQDEFAIQIKSEVDKAEEALLNYQYADSLKASDRAISAANAFLSSKRQDIDVKTILLAAISLAFILVAAYYFAFGSKKKGEKEKRAVPKSAP